LPDTLARSASQAGGDPFVAHQNMPNDVETTKRDYANYHVGLKILLRKDNEFLFLRTPNGKQFDLPGGRIDDIEHNVPLVEVIERKVCEELRGD